MSKNWLASEGVESLRPERLIFFFKEVKVEVLEKRKGVGGGKD
jgi:hypothetical protein